MCTCMGGDCKSDQSVFGSCFQLVLYRMSKSHSLLIGHLVSTSILKPYRESAILINQAEHSILFTYANHIESLQYWHVS